MSSVFCDSGQCLGLSNQFRHKIKTIPAALVSANWCSLCVIKSEEKELYLDHDESKKLFLVSPDTCYHDLCLLYESNSSDSLDMQLNEFINSCIKLDLDLEGGNESNERGCII